MFDLVRRGNAARRTLLLGISDRAGADRRDRLGGAPVRHRRGSAARARGRQPRLAVIDYASVDARRRLILVRRDNVEHLLMIGGPTDVVVEANIVRAVAGVARRAGGAAARRQRNLPRAIPLPEAGRTARGRCSPSRRRRSSRRAAPASNRSDEPAPGRRPHAELPRPQRDSADRARRGHRSAAPTPRSAAASGGRSRPAEPRTPAAPVSRRSRQRRPIKASPKWRSGSKQRCASRRPPTKPRRPRDTIARCRRRAAETEAPPRQPRRRRRRRRDPRGRADAKPARAEAKAKEGKALRHPRTGDGEFVRAVRQAKL